MSISALLSAVAGELSPYPNWNKPSRGDDSMNSDDGPEMDEGETHAYKELNLDDEPNSEPGKVTPGQNSSPRGSLRRRLPESSKGRRNLEESSPGTDDVKGQKQSFRWESKNPMHKCNLEGCNATFQSLEHLKRHLRKHTGEKPFSCLFPGCSKNFSRHDNMLQHLRTHSKALVKGNLLKSSKEKLNPSTLAAVIKEYLLQPPSDQGTSTSSPATGITKPTKINITQQTTSKSPTSANSPPSICSQSSSSRSPSPSVTSSRSPSLSPRHLVELTTEPPLESDSITMTKKSESKVQIEGCNETEFLGRATLPHKEVDFRQLVPLTELFDPRRYQATPRFETDWGLLGRFKGPE